MKPADNFKLLDQLVPAQYLSESVKIYIDGGARDNPGTMGGGIYIVDKDKREFEFSLFYGDLGTNNRAETLTLEYALSLILKFRWKKVDVYCDSQYSVNAFNRDLDRWRNRKWRLSDGNKVKNLEVWKAISTLKDRLNGESIDFTLHWIKAHQNKSTCENAVGNDAADSLATQAIVAAKNDYRRSEINITDGINVTNYRVNYENKPYTITIDAKAVPIVKEDRNAARLNPLIACRRIVFTTNSVMKTPDGGHLYMSASFSKGRNGLCDKFGTEEPDNQNSIVILNEPIEQIEELMEFQNSITPDDYQQPVCLLLDKITKPVIWKGLTEDSTRYLTHTRFNIHTTDNIQLTEYVRPAKKAYVGINRLVMMYERLLKYFSTSDTNDYIDITDHFYVKPKSKWSVTETVKKSAGSIKVRIPHLDKELNLVLTYGVDLPPKARLGTIAKSTETLKVILAKFMISDTHFRFSTIFVTDEGKAIYETSHSNLQIFK